MKVLDTFKRVVNATVGTRAIEDIENSFREYRIKKAREDADLAMKFSLRSDDPEREAARCAMCMNYGMEGQKDAAYHAFISRYVSEWHTWYDQVPDNAIPLPNDGK